MDESFERAMAVRRQVLGDDYVDAVTTKATAFTAPFQQFVTRWAWGEAWLDDTLEPQVRSLLTIAVVTVLGQLNEIRLHVRGALRNGCSPEQIARRLRRDHPDRPELHVTHETIYQALYVQGRGQLRRELSGALRTGRAARKPRRQPDQRRSRFTAPMVMISDRPAQACDRAYPGHWEGDLIMGLGNASAIGTLVERATRYVMLVHLPGRHDAETVRDGLIATITGLPEHLRQSLTWDQGVEMARHHEFSAATGMQVYFCDPHSPWQRGSNENTNGLLRQYFPKGTDLSVHTAADLAAVAAQLNRRPRKTLGWDTPAERLAMLLTDAS